LNLRCLIGMRRTADKSAYYLFLLYFFYFYSDFNGDTRGIPVFTFIAFLYPGRPHPGGRPSTSRRSTNSRRKRKMHPFGLVGREGNLRQLTGSWSMSCRRCAASLPRLWRSRMYTLRMSRHPHSSFSTSPLPTNPAAPVTNTVLPA